MKTILVLFLFFLLFACADYGDSLFRIVNPENSKTVWERHNKLPQFNAKYHSDGCSGGMSAIYQKLTFLHKKHGKTLEWRKCCVVHDKAYYYGGTKLQKEHADSELNRCVTQVVGKKYLGKAMQIAVKIGGGPNLPTPYRWGYGEDFRSLD